jgi:phosphoesterase RecJ-like protein
MKFLDGASLIEKYNPNRHNSIFKKADLIIVVDLNDITRIRELEKPVSESSAFKIVVDHHLNPKDFANYCYINSEASSTGELVWNILENDSEYSLNSATARALYAAILTDTGSFRFPKTTSRVHYIISKLIDAGADPYELYEQIYNQNPINSTRLLGLALSNMKLYENGKVCIMMITEEDFRKTNTTYKDTEFFVERTLSVEGVQVGVLISDAKERNEIKISLRSKKDIPVNKVAIGLGGGGHLNAAGANIKNASPENALEMVLRQISKLSL